MPDVPLTTQQVQEVAQSEVNVGGDTLFISKVHVRMPLICFQDVRIRSLFQNLAMEE